ncbi:MAG: hypothetical protein ACXVQT_11605 [Actinomycetota bacterium]
MPLLRRRPGTRVFYAADLHGSTPAWRRFVNAAAFYDADALVFGGDLMGKALVPIVERGGRFRAEIGGDVVEVDRTELPALAERIEVGGHYWKVMEPDEHLALPGIRSSSRARRRNSRANGCGRGSRSPASASTARTSASTSPAATTTRRPCSTSSPTRTTNGSWRGRVCSWTSTTSTR